MNENKLLTGYFSQIIYLFVALAICLFSPAKMADETNKSNTWHSINSEGGLQLHLYFFWSKKCPHCLEAVPFVEILSQQQPWITTHSLELTEYPEHVKLYTEMAFNLGQEANSVPAFFWCSNMAVGYDNEQGMGKFLLQKLEKCREQIQLNIPLNSLPQLQAPLTAPINIPFLGELGLDKYSLPTYTIILAGLDAFNPCAFFVLLFLLSLLVHAKNRARMLIVGGIFVFFSGFLYFLFMAAWLNVFLFVGQVALITTVAGSVAVVMALINIKDYFWFKKGVSLSIPESAKPGLFQRMRGTIQADKLTTMIIAAIGLAAFANLYEFLCTAGFPMVFTRILTLNELSSTSYYLYLLLYNIIYIIPLLVIVVLFSITLGAKKLQDKQGKILKLISGVMMLCLGLVLLINSDWLNNAGIAVALLFISLMVSGLIVLIDRKFIHNQDMKLSKRVK